MLKNLIEECLKEAVGEILIGDRSKESADKPGVGSKLDQAFVGRKVMVRTYSAGVHFGELIEKAGQQAILKDSRRVFYWTKACSLSQLSQEGSGDIDKCQIAMVVPEILLDRIIEVIPLSKVAEKQLFGANVWKK